MFGSDKFKFYSSLDEKDCGPTCLQMVAKFYQKTYSLESLREKSFLNRDGVNILNLGEAAKAIGFDILLIKTTLSGLFSEAPLPCIIHWGQDHFVVVTKIVSKGDDFIIHIADPAIGKITYRKKEFLKGWCNENEKGIALLLEPSDDFVESASSQQEVSAFTFLFGYVKTYKKAFLVLCAGIILTTCLSLVFPFLTQYMIDIGLRYNDYNIIVLILVAQFFIFLGDTAITFIRGWILLHLSSRVSISIISNFLEKLLGLPYHFFEIKTLGDISQRINDHTRIEGFLTGNLITVSFSLINIAIYLLILLYYNLTIFFIFLIFSSGSILWVLFFMRQRKKLDYEKFNALKRSQEDIYEIFNGIQEIKLNRAELKKRRLWEIIQLQLFNVNIKSLGLEQKQRIGYLFFSNIKNLLLTFVAATATLNGSMTLGMLLSISYIIGQTNSPLEQLINFFKAAQDAKISISRMQEIQYKQEENYAGSPAIDIETLVKLTTNSDLILNEVSFQYDGPHSPFILDNLNLTIPYGRVTAIVGMSGGGKTTLMKLLLKFHNPVDGQISIGIKPLLEISPEVWRSVCGAVMQDGYIFSDTILQNIVLSEKSAEINQERLERCMFISNAKEFIDSFPNGLYTKIGPNGIGLSAGQKQRLLIARAVYSDPKILIFDEATSALDAKNERIIVERLQEFFIGKTVVVIAHRLSTVSHADQIVVLEEGSIKEIGSHKDLVTTKGIYYHLVKNQLELGT